MTDCADINESVNNFTSTLLDAAKQNVPNKKCIIRPHDKPWMRNYIRREIRKRRRLHRKAKRTNNDIDWSHYRTQRNIVIGKIRQAKLDYFEHICENIQND